MEKSQPAKWVSLVAAVVLIAAFGIESYTHAADADPAPDEAAAVWAFGARGRKSGIDSDLTPPGNPYVIKGGSSTPLSSELAPPANLHIIDPSEDAAAKTAGQKRKPFAGFFEEPADGTGITVVPDWAKL